jgi:energy-coupling factor transport system substrate-specific component
MGGIVSLLKLPFYLDTIGTFLISSLAGLWYGIIGGVISSILGGFVISPTAPAYVGTQILIAVLVYYFTKVGFLRKFWITIIGGILIGIGAALVSAPVTAYLYGGVSLAGADAVTAFFRAMGKSLLQSVILGGLSTDPIDKLLTALIAMVIYQRIPERMKLRLLGKASDQNE